mmetsp:Transcript_10142/g.15221  ORF Transcript_10142/g.15221 Transcript_10142/m.15221 type:complete len:188 (-) Transcript_10142:381-944(-)
MIGSNGIKFLIIATHLKLIFLAEGFQVFCPITLTSTSSSSSSTLTSTIITSSKRRRSIITARRASSLSPFSTLKESRRYFHNFHKTQLYQSNDDEHENEDASIHGVPTLKTNDQGETYFDLAPDRRFTVCKWRGNVRLDIREFYEKNGKMLPGKKGLSLTMEQFNIIKDFIQDGTVDDIIRELEDDE